MFVFNKMDLQDFKFYAVSMGGFAFSFTTVNNLLKFLLLIVSIAYTGYKVFRMIRDDMQKHADEVVEKLEEQRQIQQDLKKEILDQVETERQERESNG